ncbi:MAG: hypothetical protein ABFS38_16885 [Bacteroidota bacterium]
MKIVSIWGIIWLFAAHINAQNDFQVSKSGELSVSLKWETFITRISFDLSSHEYKGMVEGTNTILAPSEEAWFDVEEEGKEVRIFSGVSSFDVPWCCEVSAWGDRLEINFAALFPPKDYGQEATHSRLKIYVPVNQLVGCDLEYMQGRVCCSNKKVQGRLTGEETSSETPIYPQARYIQFSGVRDLFFDMCPNGAGDFTGTAPITGYKGHIERDGDHYVFIIPTYRVRWGGKVVNKIVIRNGRYNMDDIHPVHRYHYTWPMPSLMRFAFTDTMPPEGFGSIRVKGWNSKFTTCDTQTYRDGQGYGWVNSGNLHMARADEVFREKMGSLLSEGIRGNGPATFRFRHPDARVITTLVFSGAEGKDYDITVSVNHSKPVNATVIKGEKCTVLMPAVIREGKVDVSISGEGWMLSGIIPTLIMGLEEDYQYDRNWWVAGKEPWKFKAFIEKARWKRWPDGYFCDAKWNY